jgi:hypothetical protein
MTSVISMRTCTPWRRRRCAAARQNVAPTHHPLSQTSEIFKFFASLVADAIFKIYDGEKERITAHLRVMGLGEQEIRGVSRVYYRKRSRKRVLEPGVLERDLASVYDLFRGAVDPTTGRPFFRNGHELIFEKEMKYVRKGYLSDPPGLEM